MTAPAPVLILKTGGYAIHHGQLGIIRSLGKLGIPVYPVAEDHLTPAGTSRYLAGKFVWHAGDLPRPQLLEALTKIGKNLDRPMIWGPSWSPKTPRRCGSGSYFPIIRQLAAETREQADAVRALPSNRRALSEYAVPHVDLRCVRMVSARFPIVVKPAAGWLHVNRRVSIVHSEQELVDVWHRAGGSQNPNLLLQEYIPPGADWLTVPRPKQVDGRVLVLEPDDLRASVNYFWRGELSAYDWLRSFKGRKELAWLNLDDPLNFLMVWPPLRSEALAKYSGSDRLSPTPPASRPAWVKRKPDQVIPLSRYGLWSGLISVVGSLGHYLARPWWN